MKANTRETFKDFFRHALKYKISGSLVVFGVIGSSVVNLIPPLFFRRFFDVLTGDIVVESIPETLIAILISILGINLIGWVLWRVVAFSSSRFQSSVLADLLNDCFSYLHKHSTTFFNNNFVGSLVRRVNRYARAFESITDMITFELLPIFVTVVMIVAVLANRSLILGLAVLVWIVVYVSINFFFSKHKLKYDIQKSELDSKVTATLADTITNHLNVKFFTGYGREKKNFARVTDSWRRLQLFTWDLGNYFEAVQTFLMIILEIGIFYFAIKLWEQGIITVGDFVLIQAYLITIFGRLWNVGRIVRRFYESLADAEEMTEILQTEHEITDGRYATILKVPNGMIEFDSVRFSYNKTRRVISNLNVTIHPKERVAFVGRSGSGKTTLVNLILRNFDVEKGNILIDRQKITKVTQDSLRKNISVVTQESILFHRSLRENIRYGKPNATNAEVEEAAKLAYAHDFISKFPDGYNTYVGERGVKLSGGERQRVAISRAILKNAPILVLDEATSSLDSESEQYIQRALEKLMEDKTVIVVAHRLSTIMKMDRILVLENGAVVEDGDHASLIKKNGSIYKSLWERQVGGFIG